MPTRPRSICTYPGCADHALSGRSRCAAHPYPRTGPARNMAQAGYGYEWQQIRREVLRAHSIPESEWPLYDVDHRPPYNPAIEPDHRQYALVPMLKADHSRKTREEAKRRKL